jgi:hypothetical protein
MEVVIEALAKREIAWYKKICEAFSELPELSLSYERLVILFMDSTTTRQTFNQKLSQYLGTRCDQTVPSMANATALKGIGVIAVRIDDLSQKSKPFRHFAILEEFCHLLDYKGDSTPLSSMFWEFIKKFSQVEDHKFAELVAKELNGHFNHFNVNKLLMRHNFNEWMDFRRTHYGKQHRQKIGPFYEKITSTHNQKQSLAIFITEIVKVISFSRAVESFVAENEGLTKKKKRRLETIVESSEKTILFMEEYARTLDPRIEGTSAFLSQDSFASKDKFFEKVTQFWIRHNLIRAE